MPTVIEAPISLMESMATLRLPPKADAQIQRLMDKNNDGQLTPTEREELEALVEWSESIALIKAEAMRVLGRIPQ